MVDRGSGDAFVTATVIATVVWLAQAIMGPRIPTTIRRSVEIAAPIERVWRALDPFATDYVPTANVVRAEREPDGSDDVIRLHSCDPNTEDERVDTLERLGHSTDGNGR